MRGALVKLSGHIFDEEGLIKKHIEVLRRVWSSGVRIALVVGGGGLARRYISIARELGAGESMLDMIGIWASRLNALLMVTALGDIAYPQVPTRLEEALTAWLTGRMVVMGGLQPGQSTATVAMLVAEYLGLGTVVDCANVDAVYTGDPRVDKDARRLRETTVDELLSILRSRALAGTYDLLDPWALVIAKRSGLVIYVVDCRKPSLLEEVLVRGTGYGTRITPGGDKAQLTPH